MSLPGVSDVRSFFDTVSSHSQEPASPSCHLCSSGPLLRTQTSGSLVVYLSLFFSLCPASLFPPPFSPTSYFSILCLSILDLSFLPPLTSLSPLSTFLPLSPLSPSPPSIYLSFIPSQLILQLPPEATLKLLKASVARRTSLSMAQVRPYP